MDSVSLSIEIDKPSLDQRSKVSASLIDVRLEAKEKEGAIT